MLVGSIGVAIASAALGFEIGKRSANRTQFEFALNRAPDGLETKLSVINRETDIYKKLEVIEAHILSNDWIDRLGGILVCFSELETFLSQAILLSETKHGRVPRSYFRKINRLKDARVITAIEHDLLRKINPVRNALVHGRYTSVSEADIDAVFVVIKTLFVNHIGSRGAS